jgi:2-iminobutanoate/2-iminopropanoate deaminase
MTVKAIRSDRLAPAAGPFSQAVATGGLLLLSGQVGQDPSGALVAGGVEAEARQIFANLAAVLAAAGKGFGDVVQARIYLTDIADFAAVNAIYAEHFEPPYPARTTIAVAALPLGAAIEIDLVAEA